MLKNYFKIAWRNILREKGYAFINVFGLAVGIAFCILIYLFIRDELTYDRFNKNSNHIFRVEETSIHADGSKEGGNPSGPVILGSALQSDVPGIKQYVRFQKEDYFLRARDASTEAVKEDVLFADPSVLKVFTFPLRLGNAGTALSDPNNVVITSEMAHKYFGNENPMGKILQIRLNQKLEDFKVSGVAENIPGNSTIQFGILLPFKNLLMYDKSFRKYAKNWHFYSPQTYIELNPKTTEQQVETNLSGFYKKYHKESIAAQRKAGDYDRPAVQTYDLNPLRKIHLTANSDPIYSYILGGIALAVLIIACINFMTLSIGRSVRRAKEVGIRKVIGAERKQVMLQFWGEAFLLSAMALVLGLVMAEIFLPVFNHLTGKVLAIGIAANWTTALVLAGLVIFTSLIAGSYPALVLSGFKPIKTLTKRLHVGKSGVFSKSLVVFQFTVTIFLVISTLIMARQLSYTRSMDLGFNTQQVVVVPTNGLNAGRIADRFRTELKQQTSIADITASGNKLGRTGTMGVSFELKGKRHTISVFRVDSHYLDFLGLDLVAGRNFIQTRDVDSSRSVIVDEALVHDFGFENPVGQTIQSPGVDPGQGPRIIGVVKDYHFQSLYKKVGPVMLTVDPDWDFEQMLVRIRPGQIPKTIDLLKTTWQKVAPEVPFTYHFLDDQMQAEYANDLRWSKVISYAALFAIFIACLGLLGLTALTVTRRTKEIGIRKVLGAKVHHIVILVSKELTLLVLIGSVLALPAAYIAMQSWLKNFAYRVPLSVWIFILAIMGALGLTLLTVGYHAIKSALANPVDSLRSE